MKYFYTLSICFILFSCGETENKNNPNLTPAQQASLEKQAQFEACVSDISEDQLLKAQEILAAADQDVLKTLNAKTLYSNNCMVCHGENGDVSIRGSKVLAQSKTNLEERISQIYHGKGAMTPFGGLLSNEEVVCLAKYIEEFR